MDQFSSIYSNRLKPWWSAIDAGARFQIIALTLAAVAALAVTMIFVLKPNYETLYTGLDPAEGGQIIEKLKVDKIPYRVENGGTAISVPRKNIYDLRLELASEGLPRSGNVGYEIFDKTNLGMTDFLQKVNYRRAMEGELAKSICSIDAVKTARVHLVIPEPRLFAEDRKEATASIVLDLYGARNISDRQVEGIAYLVSSSVEGLSPDNVTILDSSGRLLSEKHNGDGISGLSSSQMDLQHNVEAYLEDKARGMLDPIIGAGKSVVSISAQLNFEQVEKTMETYDPDNLAIRSEERNQQTSSEQNVKETGVGKTVSNSSENVVTNYEVNKTVQHVINQVGNVGKLSIAVVVDGTYKQIAGKGGEQTQQYIPRSQDELDKIANMVKGAVGFDPLRNDVLEIANVAFEPKNEIETDNGGFMTTILLKQNFDEYMDIGLKVLLIAIALFAFLRIKKKLSQFWGEQKAHADRIMAQQEAEKKNEQAFPKLGGQPQLADHFRAIASERPAEIARVIKTMMVEN